MKHIFTFALVILIAFASQARDRHLDLIFERGQIELVQSQKDEITDFLKVIETGDNLAIYPLTHDKANRRLFYAKIADQQAAKIADFATTVGLQYVGTPRNFPSSYRGVSVRVNLTYLGAKKEKVANNGAFFPEKPAQFFDVDPNKDTVLFGDEGTAIYIKAGALLSKNPVEIELVEYYSLDDYIKSGLQTSSNGEMIVTGGTVYLNAQEKESKKQVGIDQEKGIGLDFTIGKDDPDMQIFVQDPNSEGRLNWVLPKKVVKKGRWTVTETTYDYEGNIVKEEVFTSREAWEEHLRKRKEAEEKRAQEIEDERILNEEKAEIAKKAEGKLKIYDFGLINCDKFYGEEMTAFALSADPEKVAQYYLVFSDVRGVMQGSSQDGEVKFGRVPKGKAATLIAFSFVGDKKYFFKKDITIGSSPRFKAELKQVAEDFINQQLELLKQ